MMTNPNPNPPEPRAWPHAITPYSELTEEGRAEWDLRLNEFMVQSLIIKKRERTPGDLRALPNYFDKIFTGPKTTDRVKQWFSDACARLHDEWSSREPVSFNHFLTLLRRGRKSEEEHEKMLRSLDQVGGDK